MTLTQRINPEKLEHAASMLRVLSHPVRLAIVDLLFTNGPLSVQEIQEKLGLEQAITSQHLILMKDKGVLTSVKEGRCHYFSLLYPNMKNIIHCLEECCNL